MEFVSGDSAEPLDSVPSSDAAEDVRLNIFFELARSPLTLGRAAHRSKARRALDLSLISTSVDGPALATTEFSLPPNRGVDVTGSASTWTVAVESSGAATVQASREQLVGSGASCEGVEDVAAPELVTGVAETLVRDSVQEARRDLREKIDKESKSIISKGPSE